MLGHNAQLDNKVNIFIRHDSFYFYRRNTGIVSLALCFNKEKVYFQKSLVAKYRGILRCLGIIVNFYLKV